MENQERLANLLFKLQETATESDSILQIKITIPVFHALIEEEVVLYPEPMFSHYVERNDEGEIVSRNKPIFLCNKNGTEIIEINPNT